MLKSINVADLFSVRKNLKDLNKYKKDLKYDFWFTKLITNPDDHFFKYAEVFGFSGLLSETREDFLARKKKEMEDKGEKFDPKMVVVKKGQNAIVIRTKEKVLKEYIKRKPADYLRKYDYRKLAFELKAAQKKN